MVRHLGGQPHRRAPSSVTRSVFDRRDPRPQKIRAQADNHFGSIESIAWYDPFAVRLLMGISDIAVSSGSACTSATLELSYVLKALGAGDDLAHSSIRFGLGRFNTEEEVDFVGEKVVNVVRKLRELSPLYEMAKEGVDLSKVEWAAH